MERNKVVLVDENDQDIKEMDKLVAHEQGHLHRAFSVFVFNDKGELLLQQRADHKYHGGGLWANTCCSHPQWGEDVKASAQQRLQEEMGMTCMFRFSHTFIYHTPVENNLIEHELDHVFVGFSNEQPVINPTEVKDFKWMTLDTVLSDMMIHSDRYTYWFKMALPQVISRLNMILN